MESSTGVSHTLRSMTGFARVRRATRLGELTVSLRSVNHRGLDLHFHQTGEFVLFENAIRERLRRGLARGHVEVRIDLYGGSGNQHAGWNRELLAQFLAAFEQARTLFALDAKPDLNVAFRLPGMFTTNGGPRLIDESFGAELLETVDLCLSELNAYRSREGGQLAAAMARESDWLEGQIEQMGQIRREAVGHFQRRLEERLRELLDTAPIDPRRLAEEAALLTERSDIEEELTRLSVHNKELRLMLNKSGPAGKTIDFLLQEMVRETNTVLSKTSGIGETGLAVTNLALGVKGGIERIREQALNLE